MPRSKSPVRAGKLDQRDRGRRKKHHKARLVGETLPLDQFQAWLRHEFRDADGQPNEQPSQGFSLKRYLQASPNIDLAPDEKLRQLAIFWEAECSLMDQPKGWHILRRVYREAIKYNPLCPFHYHSFSLSARSCSVFLEAPLSDSILAEAIEACRIGIDIAPEHADLHTSLGKALYELSNFEEAIESLDRALEIDPQQMWAAYWKTCCLLDLEQWSACIEVVESIDLGFFKTYATWRVCNIKDMKAHCHLQLGNDCDARKIFEHTLTQYEKNPGLLVAPQFLVSAAEGQLVEIEDRLRSLLEREDMSYWWNDDEEA